MKTIAILTTGGTIAMKQQGDAGVVPTLGAQELIQALPNDIAHITVEDICVEDICNLPSPHLTVHHLWTLRSRVVDLLFRQGAAGVVITHGTDTMEETAFYLDITVNPSAPVVLTGAMRSASEAGYDGLANLTSAVRLAASDAAAGLGTLIVMNDEIHLARWATKSHTSAMNAFSSPDHGPIGRLVGKQVMLYACPPHRPVLPAGDLAVDVPILPAGLDSSPAILQYLTANGTRGVVIEGTGAGHVPPAWLESIRQAVSQGMTVVISSRSRGPLYDKYGYLGAYRDLAAAGCLFSDGIDSAKCRIKLMAILGQAGDTETIRRWWEMI
ncbi:MAG: asparaginase [Anaerolineae bacterium]